jgi:hypothetical protein
MPVNLLQRKITRSAVVRLLALLGGFLISKNWIDLPTWTLIAGNEEILAGLVAAGVLLWDSRSTKRRDVEVAQALFAADPKTTTLEEVERSVRPQPVFPKFSGGAR